MRRTYERGTKARLCFTGGGPHVPVNTADNMEEVNVGGKKTRKELPCLLRCISYAKL